MKLSKIAKDILIENRDSNYLNDGDYQRYVDNAKDALKNSKKIEKLTKGTTRRGNKYVVIQYTPSGKFVGGDFTEGIQFFYKDDDHLEDIMKELNLSMNLLK